MPSRGEKFPNRLTGEARQEPATAIIAATGFVKPADVSVLAETQQPNRLTIIISKEWEARSPVSSDTAVVVT